MFTIPGDNLASQYLGGYKLNAAFRKCRHCLATACTGYEYQSKLA